MTEQHCEGKKKAWIEFRLDTNKNWEKLEVENPPISVDIIAPQAGWYDEYDGLFGDCKTPYFNQIYWLNDEDPTASYSMRADRQGTPPNCGKYGSLYRNNIFVYHANGYTRSEIKFKKPTCKLEIRDGTGTLIFSRETEKKNSKCPIEIRQITCDDECPPNHIKCECSKPPGYCCIPCGEIVGPLNALANRIRC